MPYSRLIIGFAIFILLVTIATGILQAMQEPSNGGRMKDSYGTRFFGSRGAYDTLKKLGLPVERSLTPPDRAVVRAQMLQKAAGAGGQITMVIWSPSPSLVDMEPQYLRSLRDWVEDGGRLVLAQGRRRDLNIRLAEEIEKTPLPDLLGLEGLRAGLPEQPESSPEKPEGPENAARGEPENRKQKNNEERKVRFFGKEYESIDLAQRMYGEMITCAPVFSGAFQPYAQGVKKLSLPQIPERILDFGKTSPAGKMELEIEGKKIPFGAVFRRGKGEIVYLADAALLFNRYFPQADNSVLCAAILAGVPGEGRGLQRSGLVLIDEFFHGLNVQGNVWWLLTRMPYGPVALVLTLAAGLWAWRGARRLGPPVTVTEPSRRSLREYVQAMAALFRRAGMRRYIFEEAYRGELWHLRRALKLNPKLEDAQSLANALERKEPGRAARLLAACRKAEALLQQPQINRRDAVQVLRELAVGCRPDREE